ncbi:protein ImuB [Pseudidiomarina indica]|uniref:Protein ImuB n=1 Tax=Pseudidiomarina indica TaxID=1159017 RepID=A0A1G6E2U0_9GAMM|nr:DNA polymerase Y family protein [Pseudidiomarina indica]SDB51754.1 protein ImuB [Pseudidiomarina indica]
MNAWLYLHFPHLLLDYQQSLQPPEVAAVPVALIQEQATQRPVIQVNQAALQLGLKVGMAEVVASTLCPQLQLRPYQPEQEERILTQLAQVLYQDIAHLVLAPPHGLMCDIRSILRLHGGYQGVLGCLQHRLQQWPLRYVLSSGNSPLAAQLLALSGQPVVSENVHEVNQALWQLPIEMSGLSAAHISKLRDVGLTTLGAVLQRPRAELGERFGRALLHYLAALTGEVIPPQTPYHPPERFDEKIELVAEAQSWAQLMFPLKRLLQQVEGFLESHQWSTRGLMIRAHHRDGPATQVAVRLVRATWQHSELFQLSQLHLARQQLPQPVLALSIRVLHPEPRQAVAPSLIGKSTSTPDELAGLVSRLQARLGEQKVQQLRTTTDWRPEYQGQLQAWQAMPVTPVVSLQRPYWLLPQAQAITRHEWQLQWGPERIVSGWWQGDSMPRDYYIAIDKEQRQGWIYYCAEGWFLHGWFS